MVDPRTPVIVGVGQLSQRVDRGEPALEPVELMTAAARRAGLDAGADVLGAIETIRVVGLLSWRYPDPGRLVGRALGLDDAPTTAVSPMGGNSPQMLVNRTAAQIVAGELDCALLVGGEAWRTRMSYRRDGGAKPPWREIDESVPPAASIGEPMEMSHEAELALGIAMPVQVYPIFEQARRHHLGRSIAEHMPIVAELWSRFSAVAATNPHAWRQQAMTAEEIATPSADNRYVGFPYTKVMNSYENVDQGAALMLCSAEKAAALGVPRDRWIFPHGGADAREHPFISNRADLHSSPAIGVAARALYDATGLGPDTIDHLDLYSCFPAAVQFGVDELGLDFDRQLTQTGGLGFAGGPWNNYSMHGIAALVDRLRADGGTGLAWANGGLFTKQSIGIYGSTPPASPFVALHPQAEVDALPFTPLAADHVGTVTIESWTVMHDASNEPQMAIAAVRTPDGARAWARSSDHDTCVAMSDGTEYIGVAARRSAEGTLTLD